MTDWKIGKSKIRPAEVSKLVPAELSAALEAAVLAGERRDRAQLSKSYRAALLARGVPKEALRTVLKDRDIDRLYEDLAPSVLADDAAMRIQMREAILKSVAHACRDFRGHQIGRRHQADKQIEKTEARVAEVRAAVLARHPGLSESKTDLHVVVDGKLKHRTVQRRKAR